MRDLLGDGDGDAVLVVLAEGLYGISLGINSDASGIDAGIGESLGNVLCTLLGVVHVNAGITGSCISITRDRNFRFGISLEEGDEVVDLSLLGLGDGRLADFIEDLGLHLGLLDNGGLGLGLFAYHHGCRCRSGFLNHHGCRSRCGSGLSLVAKLVSKTYLI